MPPSCRPVPLARVQVSICARVGFVPETVASRLAQKRLLKVIRSTLPTSAVSWRYMPIEEHGALDVADGVQLVGGVLPGADAAVGVQQRDVLDRAAHIAVLAQEAPQDLEGVGVLDRRGGRLVWIVDRQPFDARAAPDPEQARITGWPAGDLRQDDGAIAAAASIGVAPVAAQRDVRRMWMLDVTLYLPAGSQTTPPPAL